MPGWQTPSTRSCPRPYVVRTQERGYVCVVGEDAKKEAPFVGEVGVTAPDQGRGGTATRAVAAPTETRVGAETEPVSLRPFIAEEFRETFLEVYLLEPEMHLVTCIEVLSASNKRPGEGRDLYLRKRQAMLLGEANFVEVDLLRGGTRMPMLDPWPNSPYTVLVSRRMWAPGCKVGPAYSTRPLPAIPVPLAGNDPPVSLPLQPFVEAAYARGKYGANIDYSRQPPFPLTAEEQSLLQARAP